MNLRDVTKLELIGLDIEVVQAKNLSLIGLKGKIIDETKNTITIRKNNELKKLLKDQIIVNIKFPKETIQINGKLLLGRPEERIKK